MLDKEEIKKIIPQREPFLMIDEVEQFVPGESCTAYKNVSADEYYFKGHFPGNPIMPGVLMVEALAQTGAVAILSMEENKDLIPSPSAMENIDVSKGTFAKNGKGFVSTHKILF